MYSEFSIDSVPTRVTVIIPKHAEEAKNMLNSMLINSQCNYKGHARRDFIVCNKEGFKRTEISYWQYSSGLWEARKLKKPIKKRKGEVRDNGVQTKKNDYITFKIHPIDEKAVYLTRYILDERIIGHPLGGVDVRAVVAQHR
ncbi:MAG: hypothetical protein D6B28_11230 [Gammaproteobacteria bacterium]|nr:MAG: hypothetical protein D6B28_11230 [Gammaproteobacteria bacterium]